MRLSDADHRLVTGAVTAAEAQTDGEIVTIVAPTSDAYHDVGLHWAVLAMLAVPALAAAFPDCAIAWLDRITGGWEHVWTIRELATILFVAMTVTFLAVRYLLAIPKLRMAVTPRATKARRVRRRAIALFKAAAEQRTEQRTGVLLYLSLAEHQAEIVADQAIYTKVSDSMWGEAMAELIDSLRAGRPGEGMARAVTRIGAVLAEHFPRSAGDRNELPDRLIEL